jgi:hypothetical protein
MAMIFTIEQAGGEYAVYAREHGEDGPTEPIVNGSLDHLLGFFGGLVRGFRDAEEGGIFSEKDEVLEFGIVVQQARRNA